MAGFPDTRATRRHSREDSPVGDDFQDDPDQTRLKRLFSLPDGEPASFLLHNIESPYLSKRIFEHGGRVTDEDANADVILTTSRDQYKYLKDQYAISSKTHVRMSGFVDRCIDSRRFQLAPIIEKGVPGRRLASRRVEFTKDDDEQLCQYIAQVLPYKEDGGRAGHFIYVDLLRRAHEFGQYSWAHRHPKDSWRERYRKNRDRMDMRIAEIAEENPRPRDGKGLYKSRRFGNVDNDDQWMDADDEPPDLDEGERSESATDNEDGPVQVQTKRMEVQRREEEEEEEGDEDVGAARHQLATEPNQPSQGAETQGREEVEEQTTKLQPETGLPAEVAARRTRVSLNREPVQTSRRTKGSSQVLKEVIPEDIDATLRGAEVYDKLANERDPAPFDAPEADSSVTHEQSYPQETVSEAAEPENGKRKRASARTRSLASPLPPPRPRARSREHLVNPPEVVPKATVPEGGKRRRAGAGAQQSASPHSPRRTRARSREHSVTPPQAAHVTLRTRSSARIKTKATATATTALKSVSEPQVADEFVAHSDDESEMDEVEANLQLSTGPRDAPIATHSINVEDLRVSQRQQVVLPQNAIVADPDDDDDDDDDTELLEYVKKLDVRAARRQPTIKQNEGGNPDRGSSEEIFPSPGTRAGAEKRRRTQAVKDAPYVPPRGTRAASMIEKDLHRAAQVS